MRPRSGFINGTLSPAKLLVAKAGHQYASGKASHKKECEWKQDIENFIKTVKTVLDIYLLMEGDSSHGLMPTLLPALKRS